MSSPRGFLATPLATPLALALILGLGMMAGCSSFKSSSSPSRWSSQSSKSSSSPFRWSSSSSGGDQAADADESAYEKDVRETTSSVFEGGGGVNELMSQIGPVALDHGIHNWEGEPATYRAIGAGLADAGLTIDQFERVSRDVAGDSEVRKEFLMEGFKSTP
jgi:hypothetical protein